MNHDKPATNVQNHLVNTTVSSRTYEVLQAVATNTGRDVSQVVRVAIGAYLSSRPESSTRPRVTYQPQAELEPTDLW